MDRVYFIYGLGTCKYENNEYVCKDIKNGDNVVLEHLWFVTEDRGKAKEMIYFNQTDLNDGGVYPYLGLQQVYLNTIIPKKSDLIIFRYNRENNTYHRVGRVKNFHRDESDIGFIPELNESGKLTQEEIDNYAEERRKRHSYLKHWEE